MNEIQIYTNPDFGDIRTIDEDGKVLFCGNDVATALGYKSPKDAISAHCKGAVKRRTLTLGGEQDMLFISEGDIYRLTVRSKLPGAEKFETWVFDEVIPSIRKTGGYIPSEGLSDSEILARAVLIAQKTIEEKDRMIAMQAQKIEKDKPKVELAEAITASNTDIRVGALAKILKQNGIDIGQNRLFAWMRDNGYLIKQKGKSYNLPTQKSMDMELMRVKETPVQIGKGENCQTVTAFTPIVTMQGQAYFVDLFLRSGGY